MSQSGTGIMQQREIELSYDNWINEVINNKSLPSGHVAASVHLKQNIQQK